MDELETCMKSLEEMVRRSRGHLLSIEEKNLLLTPLEDYNSLDEAIERLSPSQQDTFIKLYESTINGFFFCAADGYEFVSSSGIKERFGKTLEENYASAHTTPAFMRFATAYWTLKILTSMLHDITITKGRLYLNLLLQKLELDIASVFFPTSSQLTLSIPVAQREEQQRRLILESGAKFDIEEFISGNPILQQHTQAQSRSGCLGILLAIIGIGVSLLVVIVLVI